MKRDFCFYLYLQQCVFTLSNTFLFSIFSLSGFCCGNSHQIHEFDVYLVHGTRTHSCMNNRKSSMPINDCQWIFLLLLFVLTPKSYLNTFISDSQMSVNFLNEKKNAATLSCTFSIHRWHPHLLLMLHCQALCRLHFFHTNKFLSA